MTSDSALWPWQPLPERNFIDYSETQRYPKVCIVTPSFNQGEFIEETIRSVLHQDYPNFEYFVLDGGSTDRSVEIIKKYDKRLTGWMSGPDGGQAAAIRMGWEKTDAEILAYLNSDDTYLPGAVSKAVAVLQAHQQAAAVYGGELLIDREGYVIRHRPVGKNITHEDFLFLCFISQPATFVRKKFYDRAGGINASYNNIFDFELWIRLSAEGEFVPVYEVLATTRWYDDVKTIRNRMEVAREQYRAINGFLRSHARDRAMEEKIRLNLHDRVNQILFEDMECCLTAVGVSLKTVCHLPGKARYIANRFYTQAGEALLARRSSDVSRPIVLPDPELSGVYWSQWVEEKTSGCGQGGKPCLHGHSSV